MRFPDITEAGIDRALLFLTKAPNLSSVMVGLDPTIHLPSTPVDPRLRAEDDDRGWGEVSYQEQDRPAAFLI